jgi:polysaccharide pyruvyl transferase WcaK-like protein
VSLATTSVPTEPLPKPLTPKPLTIGLMWHSAASDNLGVGALTVSQIRIVEELAAKGGRPVRFVILGWREAGRAYVTGPNITPGAMRSRDLLTPWGFLPVVRTCDLVLDIGAGDSFSDIYGTKRFVKYILAKMTVHLAGKPLVVSPQTIGPFERPWVRRLGFASLSRSAAVFARDQLSIDFLQKAGFKGQVQLASDVALRLPFDPPAPRQPGGPVKVGINVSGLLMSGGYTKANMFGLKTDYPALMRRLITHFASLAGTEVHLVSHVISDVFPIEDDYRASAALAAELPPDLAARVVLAPKFAGPSEAKSYIAGLDFFMGARMHACIAAFSSGVPVVPMAYSRKFAGLFGALDYPFTVDCTKDSAEVIEARILQAFDTRQALAESLKTALATGLDRLAAYEAVLAQLMDKTAA